MPTLTRSQHLIIGALLLAVMLATRIHLFDHALDASWAVFFIAGVYCAGWSAFAALMLAAVGIDWAAFQAGGVSAFCLSPAYAALVPAYAILFQAGRWFALNYTDDRTAWRRLIAALFAGVIGCEMVSSGSFYLFSGRFSELGLVHFVSREQAFLPHALAVTGLYVAISALLHVVLAQRLAGRHAA